MQDCLAARFIYWEYPAKNDLKMILPGTTYETNKDLIVNGIIHFRKAYSKGFEFNLPNRTAYKIAYWAEPYDQEVQVWPLDAHKFESQIVPKEVLDSPFYDSYSFYLKRADIEDNSSLTYDFSKAIYFYSAHDKYGEFSNFAAFGIDFDGLYYPTMEHYFQAQKFTNLEYAEKVRLAKTAKEASVLGNSRAHKIKENWNLVKDHIMLLGLKKKFDSYPALQDLLLSTGDAVLIENSPYDNYWGIGKSGDGFNKLGSVLMNIRVQIKNANL